MARSIDLEINYNTERWKIDGSGDAFINLPCNMVGEEDGASCIIFVNVDGEKDNKSFTLETYNDWFDYHLERSLYNGTRRVFIVLRAKANTSTLKRNGTITLTHNCAPISVTIDITQDESIYAVEANYETDGIFKSFPDEEYEEKTVKIKATGGSRKWVIKDIEQYEVFNTFEGEGREEWESIKKIDRGIESRVEYDRVFNYKIKPAEKEGEPDELIVRSYGKIDLSRGHMRYYFRICHQDVDNVNKDFNNWEKHLMEDEDMDIYEVKQLFLFQGGGYNSYKYGIEDITDVNPEDTFGYEFLINGKKKPSVTVSYEGGEIPVVIWSRCNGEDYPDVTIGSASESWCQVSGDGRTLTLEENETTLTRQCFVNYTQNRKDGTKEIIKLVIYQNAAGQAWVFTVDNNTEDFEYKTIIPSEGGEYIPVVISKKGKEDVPYTVNAVNAVIWAKWDDTSKKVKLEKNGTGTERSATFIFTQGGNSPLKPIRVSITQAAEGAQKYHYTIECYLSGSDVPFDIRKSASTYDEGEIVEVKAPAIGGYEVYGIDTQRISISYKEEENVVKFYYIASYLAVTFVDDDDTVISSREYKVGDTVVIPKDPTKEGLVFAGWQPEVETIVTKSATYKATYKAETFTITFIDWDEREISKKEYELGATVEVPENPTREGFIFKGWLPPVVPTVEGDATYKATYNQKFTVKFLDWDDTEISSKQYLAGEKVEKPSDPTREGYTFAGWNPKVVETVTGDATYKATYDEIPVEKYTVQFLDWDDRVISSKEYELGDEVEVPADPTREDYKFTGWQPEVVKIVAGNAIYKATYEAESKPTYYLNFMCVVSKDYDGDTMTETKHFMPSVKLYRGQTEVELVGEVEYTVNIEYDEVYDGNRDATVQDTYSENRVNVNKVFYNHSFTVRYERNIPWNGQYLLSWGGDGKYYLDGKEYNLVVGYYEVEDMKVTITYKDGIDGTTFHEEKLSIGSKIPIPTPPEHLGFMFDKWSPDLHEGDTATESKTYTAMYYVPESVGLDLPSGTIWAWCNLGAENCWEHGKYFQWADTQGYYPRSEIEGICAEDFSYWRTCPFNDNQESVNVDYFKSIMHDFLDYIDGEYYLKDEYDAVYEYLGDGWTMPTEEDFWELIKYTNVVVGELHGNQGTFYYSKTDPSKYLFIPTSGWFRDGEYTPYNTSLWSKKLVNDSTTTNYFDSAFVHSFGTNVITHPRCHAIPIRGVYHPSK